MEPICDSMARAISDFTFTGAPPASFHSSVCLPPTDAPQRGSLSDSQGVRKEQQRRPQTRSKNGCWTCRKRRVKCDEVRPQCGGCVRLYKNCHYGYQWQLLDFGLCTGRQLRHNTPSSSSSWNRYPSSLTSDTQSTRPSFKHRNVSGISPEDTHRKKDAPSPQDSYSISTNSSFSSPSSCRPLTPLSHVTSPDEIDQDKRMRVSDFGILAKPETSSQPTLLLPRSLWNKYELPESAGSQQTPSAPRDSEDQNTVTAAEPMLNHKALTLPHIATYAKILSVASKNRLDPHQCIFPLFLSGYASKHTLQKEQALELIKSTWATSLSSDSCRLVNLLQLIYAQQTAQAQTSATTGVDWINLSRQVGIHMVDLSL